VVRRLGLTPHPEGGYYAETFRSPLRLTLPDGRVRSASTAIHYLLPAGAWSTWHRVRADEVWHHYEGAPLRLHRLGMGEARLDGDTPQAVVPAGVWQAAEPEGGAVLCGCTVAPGFEFEDFELGAADALAREFPAEAALIRRLGR
jgi:predicted cupin superfamily sugar epimerase